MNNASERRMVESDLFDRLSQVLQESGDFVQGTAKLLSLGKQYLGVQNGHITRIDPATDYWETIGSSEPESGDFPVGMTADLGQTYCRRTLEQGETIALHNAAEQGWEHDPAYERHHLETYLGTQYSVNGRTAGTVCFVSEEARSQPFTETEIAFVEFLAQLIKRTLEQKRQEEIIAEKEEIIATLSRILRHNLSNNLNVVHGHAQMIQDKTSDEVANHIDAIQRNSATLIDLAEKCRSLQTMINTEYERTQMDLALILHSAVESVENDHPQTTITVNCPADAAVNVLPVLEKAVVELVENAAKHAGDSPRIDVSGYLSQQSIEICIADDGPGLSSTEQRVLQQGDESPLAHGTGIGLWMVYWILTRHDGMASVTASETGTEVRLDIPYATMKLPSEVSRSVS